MKDAASLIREFNAGRDPERLALKLQKMRADPFVFLRGSCHLFYARIPPAPVFDQAPVTWVCGDLHLENFGSYKGDNRLVYFDLNDFDEAALAPCTWELARFLASVHLGVVSLGVNRAEAGALCQTFVDAYAAALAEGKARWVECETADGLVRDLLDGLQKRKRGDYLDSRTELKGKTRRIRIDGRKALAASEADQARVKAWLKTFAATQENPEFFRVLDVARRIAGTGSLGVERHIVLVEGKGSPEGNYLLDIKEALPSSLPANGRIRPPAWTSQAQRVVSVQQRMQAVSMAFLNAVEINGKSFVLRGLQPSEDRVALEAWKGKLRRLESVLTTMGQLTAWAQLRSGGRDGSAIADELIDFGRRSDWQKPLLDVAELCAKQTTADWQTFSKAYDGDFFA
ncbi:MAG TPA: DUF2252 domain-containing protein [Rhodocyclaceae bacterium]